MKIPSKLDMIMWAGVALLAAGAIGLVNHWRLDSGRLKVERTERKVEQEAYAARVSHLEERAAVAIENARKANEVSDEYQKRLAALEAARALTPARSVRLRIDRAPAAGLPATASSGTAGGHHAAGSEGLQETHGRSLEAGIDIGPELYAIADEADKCAAQRDSLQDWIRGR